MKPIVQNISAVLNEIAETQSGTGIHFEASYDDHNHTMRIEWKAAAEMGEGEASKFHALPKNDDRILSVEVDMQRHMAVYHVSEQAGEMKRVCRAVSGDYPRE